MALWSHFQKRVVYAIENNQIFRISTSYRAPKVREELVARGFVEQSPIPFNSIYFSINSTLDMHDIKDIKEYEQVVLYKIIGERPPDFVWVDFGGWARSQHYHLYSSSKYVNRINITGHNFTIKDDLSRYINRIAARNMASLNDLNSSVIYTLNYDCYDDPTAEHRFRKEFRLNCVIGLVLYLDQQPDLAESFFEDVGDNDKRNSDFIRLKALDLVFHVLVTHFNAMDGHIDARHVSNNCDLNDLQWSWICRTHNSIVNRRKKFRASAEKREMYISRIHYIAEEIPYYWPERMLYGCRNIYLLKPVTSGNGNGIQLLDNDRKILHVAHCKRRKYIIQKYIERPLLIYNTKFDIRQYFLITMAGDKFQAWAHPACTIKFATEEFTFDKLSESVHITNVTVQKRYTRSKPNPNLPEDNAWTSDDLIKYFRSQNVSGKTFMPSAAMGDDEETYVATHMEMTMGRSSNRISKSSEGSTSEDEKSEDEEEMESENDDEVTAEEKETDSEEEETDTKRAMGEKKAASTTSKSDPCLFKHVIYPAIKKCLTCIAELSYDQIEKKNGRFELFGCDWLITENHQVCLLEINRSPSMEYYTPKHVGVLDELLSDLVKVVIDYPKNESVSTGRFDLIFERDFATPLPAAVKPKPTPACEDETMKVQQ